MFNMFRLLLLVCLPLALANLSRPVDLSHFYDENTLYWVGATPFHFTKTTTADSEDNWYAIKEFETAEHGGTHLDAPYHFYRKGWKIGDIPLERFFGKAVYMDLRAKAEDDPDYEVVAEDFEEWEKENGVIPEGATVLLNFGWTSKYNNESEYFGTDNLTDSTSFHFPGLSADGAKWLVETGKVFGVGTDTASIDCGQTKEYIAHRILAESNIYNLEHVAFDESDLPARGYQVLALPMKIRQGTGAPCRVLAVP